MGIFLHRGSVGESGEGSFSGIFREKKEYVWVHFLDPEDVMI